MKTGTFKQVLSPEVFCLGVNLFSGEGGLLDVSDGATEKAWQQWYTELKQQSSRQSRLTGLQRELPRLNLVMHALWLKLRRALLKYEKRCKQI